MYLDFAGNYLTISRQLLDNIKQLSDNYSTITRQLLNIIRGGEMLLLLLVVPLKYYYYWTLLNPVSINSDDIDHHRRPWRACSPERGLGTTIDNRQLAISTIIIWYNETRVIHLIILGSTTRTMTNQHMNTIDDGRRPTTSGPRAGVYRRPTTATADPEQQWRLWRRSWAGRASVIDRSSS